jgi:hypothetical protein
VSLWTPQGTLSRTLPPPVDTVQSDYVLAASPDGSWLAIAPRAPLILLYDLKNPRLIAALHPRNTQPILRLSFTSDARTLAALSTDSRLTMFDIEAATELFCAQLCSPAVHVCVERRGNYAVAVTGGGTVSLHDLAAVRRSAMSEDPTPLRHTRPQDLHLLRLQPIPAAPAAAAVLRTETADAPQGIWKRVDADGKQQSTTQPHRSRARSQGAGDRQAGASASRERILRVRLCLISLLIADKASRNAESHHDGMLSGIQSLYLVEIRSQVECTQK